jgi:hypothetical protein
MPLRVSASVSDSREHFLDSLLTVKSSRAQDKGAVFDQNLRRE